MEIDETNRRLEAAKKTSGKGREFWMARDIQSVLGYATWENFKGVVERAAESCRAGGQDILDHFRGTTKKVEIGSGAAKDIEDYFLTRYACYLVAMNGQASKAEVATAQRYFAVQTRLNEISQEQIGNSERLRLRNRLTEATKHLNSAAKRAGVQNYANFTNAGYLGLYAMGLAELKRKKKIGDKENLFNRAGRLELSANEFRANLAEKAITEKNIQGQAAADLEHRNVGRAVRDTIHRESGIYPENLPAEPCLQKLQSKEKKRLRRSSKPDLPD